jgi:Uma2 family endonuclease
MAAQPDRPHWSVDQYLELERFSPVRHEYLDGQVLAMAGGTTAHGVIAANLIALLRPALRGKGCRVFPSDTKVRLSASRYVYPDVSVSCDPRDRVSEDTDYISFPCLVVEVLWQSTAAYDRGGKFDLYQELRTLMDYVLIDQARQVAEIRSRRTDGSWTVGTFGAGEDFYLGSLGLGLALSGLYEDVEDV